MQKGPFREIHRETKYKNRWLRVDEASVIRPDGSPGIFGLVYMGPGTTVVAVDQQMNVLLIKEYKYAVERETIELISGGIDDGETPEDAGLRELHEETGFIARSHVYLGHIEPFTTVVNSKNHIIMARDLEYDPIENAGGDIVTPLKIPFEDAIKMVERGDITHGASCFGLLRAKIYFENSAHNASAHATP